MLKPVWIVITVIVTALVAANHLFVDFVRDQVTTEREMIFSEEAVSAREVEMDDQSYSVLPKSVPFQEVDVFDEEADSWSNMLSQYGGAGVTVFDANGDGRLDVYFCHDGQNWTRETDEKGVLVSEPRYQANSLYLNQGNDASGQPIFRSIRELLAEDTQFIREELLVEDYLFPRQSLEDSVKRGGRSSNTAVAADFNGDGRLDLLIGNEPKGILWSHPNTQRVMMPMLGPLGRQAVQTQLPLVSLANYFIEYEPSQGISKRRESSRGEEAEGANSLYLNLGDQDGDGVPEWQDASRSSGLEGSRATYSIAVADIDLDGDLDIYYANVMDMDFWPGGATAYAGGANEFFVNQLAETGELKFVDQAAAMGIDGVFEEDSGLTLGRVRRLPVLPAEYSIAFFKPEPYQADDLEINGESGERAGISWTTVFQDVNLDNYPDLWVGNDFGQLNLFINQEGKKFVEKKHGRSSHTGNWMALAPIDYNGDLHEDLLAMNVGGGAFSNGILTFDPFRMFAPTVMDSAAFKMFVMDLHDTTHAILDGTDFQRELPHQVRHSRILPPDAALPHNIRQMAPENYTGAEFDVSKLDPYEFAWGTASLDIQNDGKPDLYYFGCLYFRGGGLLSVLGTNPGRLLVNATKPGEALSWVDLTAEHHVFNIQELKYDRLESEGYIYRRAPAQNWNKRDEVSSADRSTWSAQGPSIQEHVTNHDLIQTAEQGRGVAAGDLNGDGFTDLVLTNMGGYDSRSSEAVNLKTMIDGRPQVVPAPDNYYPTLTNFEPGPTRFFLNRYQEGNWLKVRLLNDDPRSFNRDAVGARVILNQSYVRVKRAGNGGFLGNVAEELHFGLGEGTAEDLEVYWPDREKTKSHLRLEGLVNGTLVVSKNEGFVEWLPK